MRIPQPQPQLLIPPQHNLPPSAEDAVDRPNPLTTTTFRRRRHGTVVMDTTRRLVVAGMLLLSCSTKTIHADTIHTRRINPPSRFRHGLFQLRTFGRSYERGFVRNCPLSATIQQPALAEEDVSTTTTTTTTATTQSHPLLLSTLATRGGALGRSARKQLERVDLAEEDEIDDSVDEEDDEDEDEDEEDDDEKVASTTSSTSSSSSKTTKTPAVETISPADDEAEDDEAKPATASDSVNEQTAVEEEEEEEEEEDDEEEDYYDEEDEEEEDDEDYEEDDDEMEAHSMRLGGTSTEVQVYDEPFYLSPMAPMIVSLMVSGLLNKVDVYSPQIVRLGRVAFIAYVLAHQLFVIYVRLSAKSRNDRRLVQMENPLSALLESQLSNFDGAAMVKGLASSFLSSSTTVMDYDLRQARNFQGGLLFMLALMWFLHFKMGQIQPLFIHSSTAFLQLVTNPLFQVHVLGRNLERPFKTKQPPALPEPPGGVTPAIGPTKEIIIQEIVKEEVPANAEESMSKEADADENEQDDDDNDATEEEEEDGDDEGDEDES